MDLLLAQLLTTSRELVSPNGMDQISAISPYDIGQIIIFELMIEIKLVIT